MSFVEAQLQRLLDLGAAPGYSLAVAKNYGWPRFHFKRAAVHATRRLGSGTFGTVRPLPGFHPLQV